jgi:hypothetical protein
MKVREILNIQELNVKVRVIDIQSNFQTASSSEVQLNRK